ncbi:helix-turn-helix domain-containing protein [Jiangella rhizosphaerae]|uniref:DNA-binding protein n=1 Tax=Jiangella rhizosphaerae TaxID=2293569 RepID=A0A418KHM9_9ACTN|nr:helix-turn-helix domain-containing protein [Jiangella rhizosphaerae]RIQ11423.1 DNA-binding protein [Jiangella rhizosphaerae]
MPTERTKLSTQQAAEIIGVSVSTVQRLAKSGELPPAGRLPAARGVFEFNREDVERVAVKRRGPLGLIRAMALEDAADEWDGDPDVASWLRDRAKAEATR